MISQLKGQIDILEVDRVVIDVQGVGYEVFCSARTLASLEIGQRLTLKILTHVREDHIHLYGFADAEEKVWFKILLDVQGVGPKMALAILAGLTPQDLTNALVMEDKAPFQAVSGVGPKLAARLVTELNQKSPKIPAPGTGGIAPTGMGALLPDLISALTNLGYEGNTARTAAKTAIQEGGDTADLNQLIPLALRALAP